MSSVKVPSQFIFLPFQLFLVLFGCFLTSKQNMSSSMKYWSCLVEHSLCSSIVCTECLLYLPNDFKESRKGDSM